MSRRNIVCPYTLFTTWAYDKGVCYLGDSGLSMISEINKQSLEMWTPATRTWKNVVLGAHREPHDLKKGEDPKLDERTLL